MTITLSSTERGEHAGHDPKAHRTGWERQPDGRIRVKCAAGDLNLLLDAATTPARANRYGDEHRAIVKRVAELEQADRKRGRIR